MDWSGEARRVAEMESYLVHLKSNLENDEAERIEAEDALRHTKEAQQLFQEVAQTIQQHVHQQIAKVVSSCLAAVFGEDAYTFHIEFERKRGKTEASLRFRRGKHEFSDPVGSSGGGVIDIAAFALRIACLVMHRPRLSRVVILDEPFKFVSARYQDNVRGMLENLSRQMGVQIIQISHVERLETGKVIEI